MPSVLVTDGVRVQSIGSHSHVYADLPSLPLLPPAVVGDAICFVPKGEQSLVVLGQRRFDLGTAVHSLCAHQNNFLALISGNLAIIDACSQTEPLIVPLRLGDNYGPPTMMASAGASLMLASSSHMWRFDFETLDLESIWIPHELNGPIQLTQFATIELCHSGATYVLKGSQIVPGSNEIKFDPDSKIFFLPDGSSISDISVKGMTFVSPVPEQEVPTECMICMCELTDEPSVTLYCGHAFHVDCIRECLKKSEEYCSTGDHIAFQCAKCPGGCSKIVSHPIAPASDAVLRRKARVAQLAKVELAHDSGKSEEDLLFYVCFRCKDPFFGGLRHCPRMMGREPSKHPDELICESCASDFSCEHHGRADVVYKCRLCCNPAVHRSFGCYYLCDRCDGRWASSVPASISCVAEQCPIGGNHSEGSFALGCGVCGVSVDWSKVV